MTKSSARNTATRLVAHALLTGGVLLFAGACRNGRLVFFPQSARSSEPAPMVKVATMPAREPVATETKPADLKPTEAPVADVATAPMPAALPADPVIAPPPATPDLATAPELPPVLFASDQYEVNAEQTKTLQKHAAYLKANPTIHVLLRGHTDSTASEEYNLALGQKRSESVRQALIKLGIPESRVETVSFGEALPLVEGDDAAARANNRRVEFFFYLVE